MTTTTADRRSEKVALVLGAGGARGFAQIGVIEALQARGITIATVAGSSSGALVGGIHAAGKLPVFREQLLRMSRRHFLRLLDPVFGQSGLFGGERLVAAMREVVGNPDIETLATPFTAVAVDLQRQRQVWLQRGPLWDALRASFAMPGLFTSHRVHGRELVDGGLLAPLPIAASRLSDAQRLVAVDMHGLPERPPGEPAHDSGGVPQVDGQGDAPDGAQGEQASPWRMARWFGRKAARDDDDDQGLLETMSRALDTMQAQISRAQLALDPPELMIRIPRDACQFYEFWRAGELIEIGRTEADRALDAAGY